MRTEENFDNQKNLIEYKLSELEIQITKDKEINQTINEIQNQF